jgi:molybdopterin synthase catalytic subunit
MLVVVAGDIRENVFPVLEETVNRIKKEALSKKEISG